MYYTNLLWLSDMASRLFRPGLFSNKVNIVTGGGSGIGLGIAQELLQLGSKVVIASRNPERIETAVKELGNSCKDGGEVIGMVTNIRDRDSVKLMVEATLEKFGKIDGLVNNGGGQFHSKGMTHYEPHIMTHFEYSRRYKSKRIPRSCRHESVRNMELY